MTASRCSARPGRARRRHRRLRPLRCPRRSDLPLADTLAVLARPRRHDDTSTTSRRLPSLAERQAAYAAGGTKPFEPISEPVRAGRRQVQRGSERAARRRALATARPAELDAVVRILRRPRHPNMNLMHAARRSGPLVGAIDTAPYVHRDVTTLRSRVVLRQRRSRVRYIAGFSRWLRPVEFRPGRRRAGADQLASGATFERPHQPGRRAEPEPRAAAAVARPTDRRLISNLYYAAEDNGHPLRHRSSTAPSKAPSHSKARYPAEGNGRLESGVRPGDGT